MVIITLYTLHNKLSCELRLSSLSCRACLAMLSDKRDTALLINVSYSLSYCIYSCSSRVDYCNSVLVGVSGQLLHKLQVIQNAAACIITGTKNYERVKPVLQELHWLPVRQRITYKTALLMYKCIHGLAPSYLAACCQPTSHCAGCSNLRSANLQQLQVPRTRTCYGKRSFLVNGPAV